MAMSTADYFRMMQGGVDRTGYADMMPDDRDYNKESPEDRLAKLIAQNEAEEPGDEELGGDISEEDELSIMQSLFGDDEGSFTSDEAVGQNALLAASFPAIGAAYKGGQKLIEPIAGKVTKESIEKAAETAGGKGFMKYFARRAPAMLAKRGALAATGVGAVPAALSLIPELAYMGADYFAPEATDKFEKAVGSGIKTGASAVGSGLQSANDYLRNLAGIDNVESEDTRTEDEVARDNEIASQYFMNPYNNGGRVNRYMGGMSDAQRKSGGSTHSGGPSQGPDNNKNNPMGPGLNTPVDPIKSTYTPMKQPSLIDQVKKYNFLQGVYGDEDDGLSFGYDINPYAQEASANLSYSFEDGGRVGMQAGGLPPLPPLPQYTQPTFGYDTIFPGVGIPEYNPIEKPITPVDTPEPQAYNPYVSTMPLYDPSTLGTGLPSTVGATDPYMMYDPYAPVGAFSRPPSESIGFLTEEEIKKGFEDMDRFDLQAQQAKKKAAEEAAKKTAQQKLKLAEKGGGGGPNN